jgi:integrase
MGKGGAGRKAFSNKRVAIPPDLVKELRAYIRKDLADQNGPLFPNLDGGRLQKDNYGARVMRPLRERLEKKLRVKKLDLRMLRRTAASHQLKYGSVTDLQGQMRHSKPTTVLEEYTQVIPESQHEMVNRYWKALNKKASRDR